MKELNKKPYSFELVRDILIDRVPGVVITEDGWSVPHENIRWNPTYFVLDNCNGKWEKDTGKTLNLLSPNDSLSVYLLEEVKEE